jgi:hypothetical protein
MKECARVTRRLNRGSGQSNISVICLLHDGFHFVRPEDSHLSPRSKFLALS